MHAPSLSAQDRRTLILASLGGALEFYDFIIFAFLAATLGALFFPPDTSDWLKQLQTFGIFAAGYLARPLGGVLLAHFGDLVGRKRMFLVSVLLMAVPTLLIGLLPTYASVGHAAPIMLLVLRLLQGAAVGGEVPGAFVFVSEHVPENRVGFACGVLTAGLTAGLLLGSLVASAVNTIWTADEVLAGYWRVPFVLGGFFGLLSVWLRRYLHETPVFQALRQRRALVRGLPIRHVLAGYRWGVMRSMVFTWLLTASIVVIILMTPTLARTAYAIPVQEALHASTWATVALAFSCVVFGVASDRFTPQRVLVVGAAGAFVSSLLLYGTLTHAPQYFTSAYLLAGFCAGFTAVVPVLLVRAFPAAIRYSAISFSYNVAYALSGALTPPIVMLWVRSSAHAPAYYLGIAALLAAAAATRLPRRASDARETRLHPSVD